MAVSPREILETLTEKDNEDIARIEKRLDKALREGFDGTRAFTYSADLFDCSKRATDELLKRYRAAGWIVSRQYDQRDGDYYEFSLPPDPRKSMPAPCRG